MNKPKLPPNWEVGTSRTYKERIYYFNKETGARSWDVPLIDKNQEKIMNNPTKKRKSIETEPIAEAETKIILTPQERLKAVSKRSGNDLKKSDVSFDTMKNTEKMDQKKDKKEVAKKTVQSVSIAKLKNGLKTVNKKEEQPIITPSMRIALSKKSEEVKNQKSSKNTSMSNTVIKNNNKRVSRIPATVTKVSEAELKVTNQPGKFKKNIANRRMKNLKEKLTLELSKEKDAELVKTKPIENINSDSPFKHEWTSVSRLRSFQQAVRYDIQETLKVNFDDSILEEEMEWEPIEDEQILTEVYEVRQKVYSSENSAYNMPQNEFQMSSLREKSNLYIVVDTNVFLIDLGKIEEILNAEFSQYGRPFIIVPWTVIQELDAIKDSKTKPENLKRKARSAISFLHNHFSNKHPRILGQTAADAYQNKEKCDAANPDDLIWQTCLQIQSCHPNVILLTFDKNLQNKATINKIKALGRDYTLDMIDTVVNSVNESTGIHFLSQKHKNAHISDSILRKEALFVEDVREKMQELMYALINEVLSTESKAIFGEKWASHMKIKPPWTTITILKCAELHWIAITSEAFTSRKAETLIKKLQEFFRINTGASKLKEVSRVLEIMNELVQMLNSSKYSNIQKQITQEIDRLRCICIEQEQKFTDMKFKEEIGSVQSQQEAEERAKIGLNVFEQIYVYCRDTSGAFLSRYNIPCAYFYENIKTDENFFSKERQIDLLNVLKKLLQVLNAVIDDIDHQRNNYQNIIQLFDTLMDTPLNLNGNVTPLDIYCCLKYNEMQIRVGATQFTEILTHFCKLADYPFT